MINAGIGDTLDTKKLDESLDLFEAMAMNKYQSSAPRAKKTKAAGSYGVVTVTALAP